MNRRPWKPTPLQVTLIYALAASGWIVGSDVVVAWPVGAGKAAALAVNVAKGLLFVLVTSLLLHRLTTLLVRRAVEEEEEQVAVERAGATLMRRSNQLYASLVRANADALSAESGETLTRGICRTLVDSAGMQLVWVGWVDESQGVVRLEVVEGPAVGYAQGLVVSVNPDRPESRGPAGRAILERTSITCPDILADPAMAPWHDRARRHRLRSTVAVPLLRKDGVRGALLIYSSEVDYFRPALMDLIHQLAADLVHGLEIIAVRQRLQAQSEALRESEARYRSLFEDNHAVVLLIDPESGEIMDVNSAACRFYGWTKSELCRRSVHDLNTAPREEIRRIMAERVRAGGRGVYHFQHRLASGETRFVEVTSGPLSLGGRSFLFTTVRDETELVEARKSTLESDLRYQNLFNRLEAGVVIRGPGTELRSANPRACQLLGLTLDEMAGRVAVDPAWHLLREDGSRLPIEDFPVVRVTATRSELRNVVVGIHRADGTQAWVLVNAYPEFRADGTLDQVVVLLIDVSDRRRQEESLAERERRWRDALFTSMDAFVEHDLAGRIVEWNSAFERMSGYSGDELAGMHVWDVDAIHDTAGVAERVEQARRDGSCRFVSKHRRKGGDTYDVEVSLSYSSREGGRIACFIRDITERERALQRLQVQGAALEAAANTIVITDAHGRIEWVNAAFTRATGYTREEAIGGNPRILKSGRHDARFYAELWATISGGQVWRGEMQNRRKDGTLLMEDATITPVPDPGGRITHYVAIKQDITEQKRLEQQLIRSQRMEGIGMLAGGIAHDLNNVLAPILLSVDLLRRRATNPADRRVIDTIESSARRGSGIVRQVLTFARGIDGERVPLRPADLLRELVGIIEEIFPRNIEIRRQAAPDLPLVRGDATQLHQVLLNLAVNARDAMPEGGSLALEAEAVTLAEPLMLPAGDLKPGAYVRLRVRDTGQGMPPEVRDRIFEPFFTTKPQGKGTGLGLPTVVGILRSHGGGIDVASAPGAGSEFSVYLPALPAESRDSTPPLAVPVRLQGGDRLVLVCDDEAIIREVARAVLEGAGFRVVEAGNGREALEAFRARSDEIAAVLVDIMMPLMSGDRAAAEMLAVRPDLRVLFMSGLMDQETVNAALKQFGARPIPLLRKPFTADDLVRAFEQLVGPDGAGAGQGKD